MNPKTGLISLTDPSDPFRRKLSSPNRSDTFLLILSFSGGGTRAAALSYGLLEAIERVEIPAPDRKIGAKAREKNHTLLDEVDMISSVSAGSFTAAYYGLHGKDIFKEYREKFLIQNFQGTLIWSFLNPINWFRLWSPRFGRSDIAQEHYDSRLFKGATLGDLLRSEGPAILILATDATDGLIFSFSSGMFSLICSDHDNFPVARAVAASAAFPGPLSPIVLKNYAGQCNFPVPLWISQALKKPELTNRIYHNAVRMNTYLNPEIKPYIYLVDGGVSDNLGIRGPLEAIIARGRIRNVLKEAGLEKTRRIAYIIVDAQTQEKPQWGLLGEIPGLGTTVGISSTIMINKYNFETVELLNRYAQDWTYEDEERGRRAIEFYIIHVTFDALPDKEEREYFHGIPTSLYLSADQVDKLREAAGRILYADENFQKLVRDLGGKITETRSEPLPLPN